MTFDYSAYLEVKEYVKNKSINLVMVDYLQLVTAKSKAGSREHRDPFAAF